ncbi:MAG: GAF domain-containing protein [Myxococcaceae bacterium]
MRRIDGLQEWSGYKALQGNALDAEPDLQLQQIARQASALLATPIALVSLVLKRTQFFRASHGLPRDLEQAQGTDRDASFCQFVVRDGKAFEVNDAANDPRVPQELVERYGISAYLGMPVRVGQEVVGSLCTIDTRPRSFDDGQRLALQVLALKASSRLTELSAQRRQLRIVQQGSHPAYMELRNALGPLRSEIASARTACADLAPLARISEGDASAAPVLTQAKEALEDLKGSLAALGTLESVISDNVLAIERLFGSLSRGSHLSEVVETASRLSHHLTKLVGGVRWPAVPVGVSLAVPHPVAAGALSAALSALSGQRPKQLEVEVSSDGSWVELKLSAELEPSQVAACLGELKQLLDQEPAVGLSECDGGLVLRLAHA